MDNETGLENSDCSQPSNSEMIEPEVKVRWTNNKAHAAHHASFLTQSVKSSVSLYLPPYSLKPSDLTIHSSRKLFLVLSPSRSHPTESSQSAVCMIVVVKMVTVGNQAIGGH